MFSNSARRRPYFSSSNNASLCFRVAGPLYQYNVSNGARSQGIRQSLRELPAQLLSFDDDSYRTTLDTLPFPEREAPLPRPNSTTIRTIFSSPKGITIIWGDGHESLFHYIWLRDCCQCPACRHPCSQERLLDTSSVPLSVSADKVERLQDGGGLEITWDASQRHHKTVFTSEWLREHCYSRKMPQPQQSDQHVLWDAQIRNELPEISYEEVMKGDTGLKKWLDLLSTYGFALIRNAPQVAGQSVLLAKKIAYPRETFWGTSYDVKAENNPTNLSLTGLELKCHTDFSWSEAPPKYQFLHCLKMDQNIKGGDSLLVDGFKVAQVLKELHPHAYRVLTRVKLPYYFKGENAFYHFSGPVLQLGETGDLIGVRYNQANRGPLNVPEDVVEDTYDALQKFAELLSHPSLVLRFHLRPGDLLAFNNRRLLHGRAAFSEAMERHLEGCYVDGEEFASRAAVLSRKMTERKTSLPHRHIKSSPSSFPSCPSPLNHKGRSTQFFQASTFPSASEPRRQMSTSKGYVLDEDVSKEVAAVYGPRRQEVDFVHMKDGTKEDYEFMGLWYDLDMQKNMVNRVVNLLHPLKGVKNGAKIDLYEHSLQSATRALKDGADEETVVCALLHDVGELLSPQNHGEIPAAILKPFISPDNHWILANHEVFQGYYYFHFLGGNKHTREVYKAHPCYEKAIEFCEKYDQSSFDPSYKNLPLTTFLPMVRRVFARKPYAFDPTNPKMGCVTGKK